MGELVCPFITEGLSMQVQKYKEADLGELLKKSEQAWLDKLGKIIATKMRIDLTPEAKPMQCSPLPAGPKTLQLECA